MEGLLGAKELTLSDIEAVMIDFKSFMQSFSSYEGTNIKRANEFLDNLLREDEKIYLFALLHSKDGWYKSIYGDSTNTLKLVAYMSNMTHSIFSYDYNIQVSINKLPIRHFPIELQKVYISLYLKQKLVTYKTLLNYNNIMKRQEKRITLYRGVKTIKGVNNYTSNLESWTSSYEIAKKFANSNGYILKRTVDYYDIFLCRKSAFKSSTFNSSFVNQGFNIRREHEYIIENKNKKIEYIEGNTFFSAID